MSLDKKALKILMDRYRQPGPVWREPPPPSGPAFEYAKQAGLMFDDLATSHDAQVDNLLTLAARSDKKAVAEAFVASLGTRRLDLRSALASHAVARHFPAHRLRDSPVSTYPQTGYVSCRICGGGETSGQMAVDRNVLNFERFKWGGVRKDHLAYAVFDLSQFEKAENIAPTAEDYDILRNIIAVAENASADERPNGLVKRLSGVFNSNANERRMLIETLGICGILQPADQQTYLDGFVPASRRRHTGEHTNDWGYPVIWWRGSDGVNHRAVQHFFPRL